MFEPLKLAPLGVDTAGSRADAALDADILRLENLDTDIPPPADAVAATRDAAGRDGDNSYLPFLGQVDLRQTIADDLTRRLGVTADWHNVIVTAGGTSAILTALLAVLEPSDEVILTDPVYVGIVNRVRLARGTPRFVPFRHVHGRWKLDLEAFAAAFSTKTRVVLMIDPSMPSGAVMTRDEWVAVADHCVRSKALLLYDAAFERVAYDRVQPVHPLTLPRMEERTIVIGSVSKQCRMIGWRVGWMVSPPALTARLAAAAMANVVAPVGIAQRAAALALREPQAHLNACVREWEERRNVVLEQLAAYPVRHPEGGWSVLLDTSELGITSDAAATALFERGKVSVTAMNGWGSDDASRYIRIVFSNEPRERLSELRERFARAFP